MSAMFSALSVRNYRIYATGAIISNTGTWMGRIAQDWVVLTELTDNSAQALGVALTTVRTHQYRAFRRLGVANLKALLRHRGTVETGR